MVFTSRGIRGRTGLDEMEYLFDQEGRLSSGVEEEDSMKSSRVAGEDGWSAGGSRGDSLASGYLGIMERKMYVISKEGEAILTHLYVSRNRTCALSPFFIGTAPLSVEIIAISNEKKKFLYTRFEMEKYLRYVK